MFKEGLKEICYLLMVVFNALFILGFTSYIYETNFELRFFELLMFFLIIFCFYKNCKLWLNKYKEETNKTRGVL